MSLTAISVPQIQPRPFLKWAGGKSALLSQYHPFIPKSYRFYYEPFLGGGAMFFHLQPENMFLSDTQPELVKTYQVVRDSPEQLIALLQEHQRSHCKEYYYEQRSRLHTFTFVNKIEQAARFIYLNKTCFNGLHRVNSKGQFNVPIGSYKNPAICCPDAIRAASCVLTKAYITRGDFEETVAAASKGDFVYFDPPYHPLPGAKSFNRYSGEFPEAEQERLRDVFVRLANRGVQVLLSNSDTEFTRSLYRDFPIHAISARRSINSRSDRRGTIPEILVSSYATD